MTFDEVQQSFKTAAAKSGQITRDATVNLVDDCLPAVLADWPVRTGTSADGWASGATLRGGELINDVDYASDVHDGLADELVVSCFDQLENATIRQVETPITRILEGT